MHPLAYIQNIIVLFPFSMNFSNSWKKQHQDRPFSPNSFIKNTSSSNNHAPLTFQKHNIVSCSIYEQQNQKNQHKNLTPIFQQNESIQPSLLNTFISDVSQEPDNAVDFLDISEELLLSNKQLASRRQVGTNYICPSHHKNQDVICLVDRIKICSHCALFGDHKDHNFKSQAQLMHELHAQNERLLNLEAKKAVLLGSQEKRQWEQLQKYCRVRQTQLLEELSLQFTRLQQRIESVKREIESCIKQQAHAIMQTIGHNLCRHETQLDAAFRQWLQQGKRIVKNMQDQFDSPSFAKIYGEYDTYAWLQGQFLIEEGHEKAEKTRKDVIIAIEQMRLNLNQHGLQNLASSLFLTTQIQLPSQTNFSLTSLDDLHKNLGTLKTEGNERCQNEFLDLTDLAKFRNSECLQTIHEPGRTSMGQIGKSQRLSAKCFAKKTALSSSKKENKPTADILCTNVSFFQRQKSASKLETSIFTGSRSKMKILNSPKVPKSRPDPMSIISDYQRNHHKTFLNMAECNLNEDSLAYFLQRAGKARLPVEVNLERNNMSANGFTKLLPYLVGCTKINLAFCGLGQSCLQALLRTKALRKLQQCNFSGNDINTKKNRMKLDQLKRIGIKIIINN